MKLDYEEEMEMAAAAEEEEDCPDTDVSMQEVQTMTMEAKDDIHFPVAPVLLAVKALSGLIHESLHQSCTGCSLNYLSQKDHDDCMWLEWPDSVYKYGEELDACVKEATYCINSELKKKDVLSFTMSKLKDL